MPMERPQLATDRNACKENAMRPVLKARDFKLSVSEVGPCSGGMADVAEDDDDDGQDHADDEQRPS
jgi:hypothetical protein